MERSECHMHKFARQDFRQDYRQTDKPVLLQFVAQALFWEIELISVVINRYKNLEVIKKTLYFKNNAGFVIISLKLVSQNGSNFRSLSLAELDWISATSFRCVKRFQCYERFSCIHIHTQTYMYTYVYTYVGIY